MSDTLRLSEVAEILGYHHATVSKLYRKGVLPATSSGRGGALHFAEADVWDYRDRIIGVGRWCHTEEAAELSMVSVTTVVDAINAGHLPAEKTGKRWALLREGVMQWSAERRGSFVRCHYCGAPTFDR